MAGVEAWCEEAVGEHRDEADCLDNPYLIKAFVKAEEKPFEGAAKDENENIFVYKGSYQLAEKGEEITVKATIKGHGEYKETKQTVISRPKVIEDLINPPYGKEVK